MQVGICRICKKEKNLSFEHIPPRVAFNKNTRYYSIPFDEFAKSPNFLEHKPKGKIMQGGIGFYSLCRECNSFLNDNYVRSFAKWANVGMDINSKFEFDYIGLDINNQNPFRILKQILSMFLSMNDPWFSDEYPELLEFVLNPNEKKLPDKYRIYHYLNSEGQIRKMGWSVTNFYGTICEFTFPPFGYVLNINNENDIDHLTEITGWKNYTDERNHDFYIGLYKYPTYLPIPMDFRSKSEIQQKYDKYKKLN